MKCKNCDNEATGRSKYCSDSCKTVYNRNKKSVTTETVTFDDVADTYNYNAPSLEHYQACPDQYVQRFEPDKLNWGKRMTSKELTQASLKANRVSIPGDWDYTGCVSVAEPTQDG